MRRKGLLNKYFSLLGERGGESGGKSERGERDRKNRDVIHKFFIRTYQKTPIVQY